MVRRSARFSLAILLCFGAAASAVAEFRLERELRLDPGGRLELDVDSGAVEVRGSDGSGARIVVTARRDDVEDRYDISIEERTGAVIVRADRRGRSWFSRGEGLRFEIEVPADTDLVLTTSGGPISAEQIRGDARLHTSGGPITVDRIGGEVRARTSGGPINAAELGGSADLHTSGGPIEVDGVRGDLIAETSGGQVRIRGAGGRVDASSSGGSIAAYLTPGNSSGGSLSTSGGRVTIYVDRAATLDIDAATSGGGVTVDLPITVQGRVGRNGISGSLNGGGPKLQLRSSGGGIEIRAL